MRNNHKDTFAYRISLPGPLTIDWSSFASLTSHSSKLQYVYEKFCESVHSYQAAMDEIDIIDTSCWVLEPECPTYTTLYRRISLGHHCSMSFTLDLQHPCQVPILYSLMGNTDVIKPLKKAMQNAREKWDAHTSVKSNIEHLFAMTLPSKESATRLKTELDEDMSLDCAICYAYRSPSGDAPDLHCKHRLCGRPFHSTCLVEWLRSDSSTRQSYNTLFGLCPYCSEPITVKL